MTTSKDERVPKTRVFLIDGHALVYRAFYAMISRPLRTSRGENTSAPWGIAQFIRKLFEEQDPEYVGFIFDAGGHDTYRHHLYEDYKATREKLDETLQQDFDTAMGRIREMLDAFHIPVIELEGNEADDVIGTLARHVAERGMEAVIVSGDKDFYQLIGDGILLLNPGRGGRASVAEEWVDRGNAAERLGVPPERVIDYLSLVGDSSDNIPGVRGVGPKTAIQLIEAYGSLDDIIEHSDDIPQKRAREAIKAHKDEARLSRELVTIRKDLPIALDLDALEVGQPDSERLRDLFLELEFHTLVRDVASEEQPPAKREERPAYELVASIDRMREIVDSARSRGRYALDVRTTGTQPGHVVPIGIGLALDAGEAAYLPLDHRRASRPDELALADASQAAPANLPALGADAMKPLADLLSSDDLVVIGHNLKLASHALANVGVQLAGKARDVMVESYCLDPGRRQHDIETLSLEEFGHKAVSEADLRGKGKSRISFAEVEPQAAASLSAERSEYALRLDGRLSRELQAYDLERLFEEIEMPLIPVLARMERAGIAIDQQLFSEMSGRFADELALLQEEIYKIASHEFNLNSPVQLRQVLFVELGLPVKKRTKTGPSTDADVLEELAAEGHDIPRHLIEYRELSKLKSTYIDSLPTLLDPATGRLHTTFNQAIASTGRLTSSDPNLQNIPIRTTIGAEIRKGFIPEEGRTFVGADYSQIELRVLAHLAGDPAFLEAFRQGRDIHRDTAALIFGVDPDAVSGAMRAQAKTVNFATIYGQGPMALARQLGISVKEASAFIANYFERFTAIREYLGQQIELGRERGYVETIFGRRRYIPEMQSKNPNIRRFGERVATNSPIQGSAADIIKKAMIDIDREIESRGLATRMILQVHDELLFEAPDDELPEAEALVRKGMEQVVELSVPIRVDLGVGNSWYETKDM